MPTIEVTEANFAEIVKKPGILLLDWWAPWCGPCRAFGPIFERSSTKHAEITFGKINTEQETALASSFNIQSIPTLMIIRDGLMLYAEPGMLPEPGLEDLISQVEKLDMVEVRKKIEGASKAQPASA
jgi:thioredoxin 1